MFMLRGIKFRGLSVFSFRLSILAILAVSLLASMLLPAAAVTANINQATPEVEARSTSYYRSLSRCVSDHMYGDIQLTAADNGRALTKTWFDGRRDFGYVYPDGKMTCSNIATLALAYWGWGSKYDEFLEDIGYTYNPSSARWSGTANGAERLAAFESAVQRKFYGINFSGYPTQSGQAVYTMYLNAFNRACTAQSLGKISELTNSSYKTWIGQATEERGFAVGKDAAAIDAFSSFRSNSGAGIDVYFTKINVVEKNAEGKYASTPYGYAYVNLAASSNLWNDDGSTPSNGDVRVQGFHNNAVVRSCHEIQKIINDNSADFLRWAESKAPADYDIPALSLGEDTAETPGSSDGETSCAVGGIGWIVCPVINFMAGAGDAAFAVLSDNFLQTNTSIVESSEDNGAYIAWGIIRNVANVAFVLVFLIIIFSQLTGTGIANYGVKKMLPRLVVGAILVNLSFLASQIAVDLSNLAGYGIRDVFDGIAEQVNENFIKDDPIGSATGDSLLGVFGGILAAGTIAAAGYFLIVSGGSLLLAALLALIVTLLILILREVVIIIAIVIAPLAFVAWILPNTEGLFKKWVSIFTAMLILFPAIALIYGGATLASAILGRVSWEEGDLIGQIIAALVPALALFLAIPVVQGSLKAVPMLGKLASSATNAANKGVAKRARESYQGSIVGRGRAIRKQQRLVDQDRNFAKGLEGDGRMAKLRRAAAGGLSTLGITKSQKSQREAIGRAARGAAAKAQSEAVKQEMVELESKLGRNPETIRKHIADKHRDMSDTQMEAASDLMLAAGGVHEYRQTVSDPSIMSRHARSLVESGRRNEGEVRKKAVDVANWLGTGEAAMQTNGYSHTQAAPAKEGETPKSFISAAYGTAEAAKLITMDPGTAELAEEHISPEAAKMALRSESAIDIKDGTKKVLERRAALAGTPEEASSKDSEPETVIDLSASTGDSPSGPATAANPR